MTTQPDMREKAASEPALLPCPGGCTSPPQTFFLGGRKFVACGDCGFEAPIEAWNTRAAPAALAELRAAVKEALDAYWSTDSNPARYFESMDATIRALETKIGYRD